MEKNNFILGTIFVVLGILFLVNSLLSNSPLGMDTLWPLFVLIPGLIFETSFFNSRKNPGLLVPGGILTTIGLLFLFETFTNWAFSAYTWPVYLLSVAIGLFQLYLFTGRHPALLIPVGIIGGVAVISFISIFLNLMDEVLPPWLGSGLIVPLVLVVAGVYIMFGRKNR